MGYFYSEVNIWITVVECRSVRRIGKDLEASNSDLIGRNIQIFVWRDRGKTHKNKSESRCPGWDSNTTYLENKFRALCQSILCVIFCRRVLLQWYRSENLKNFFTLLSSQRRSHRCVGSSRISHIKGLPQMSMEQWWLALEIRGNSERKTHFSVMKPPEVPSKHPEPWHVAQGYSLLLYCDVLTVWGKGLDRTGWRRGFIMWTLHGKLLVQRKWQG